MKKKLCKTFFLTAALLFLCSCRNVPFEYEDLCELNENMPLKAYDLPQWQSIALQANVVLDSPFYTTSFICMLQVSGNKLALAAMLPAGVKFLEITGSSQKAEKWYFMPGFIKDEAEQKKMANALLQDFSRIFLHERFLYPGKLPGSELERSKYCIGLYFPEKGEKRFYAGKLLRLVKKSVKNKDCNWQTEYFRCNVSNDRIYPDRIVYENKRSGYSLILRVDDFQAE